MIRTSTAIAAAAICISILVHFVGLKITLGTMPEHTNAATPTEVVAMGNAFEDIVETVTEPVPPDPAPVPEPPAESAPEPESTEAPTSQARVASDNPQNTATPDAGSSRTVRHEMSGSTGTEATEVPEPTTIEPSGGAENAVSDARMTPPVAPDPVTEPTDGRASGGAAPVEPVTAPPAPAASAAPRQLAALPPQPIAPVPPVDAAPSTVPILPSERETIEPDTSADLAAPKPDIITENTEAENETGTSELAVRSSLRPQLPAQRPAPPQEDPSDGIPRLNDGRLPPSQLIESPLTAYQRDGTNLFAGRSGGSPSGTMGLIGSGGSGNSDVTNYAGQVLVHLNRVTPVAVSARGWARVFFEINPDGTLAWVDITDSSGAVEVDRAAKEQVRRAAPFPRPPGARSRKLNFVYQIQ